MKVDIIREPEPDFVPRSITITFETQKELDGFYNCLGKFNTLLAPGSYDVYARLEEIGAKK